MSRVWLFLLLAGFAVRTEAQSPTRSDLQVHVAREGTVFAPSQDSFASANTVRVLNRVDGDLIATGQHVDVAAPIDGDAVLAGGDVRVNGRVSQDLYAAGGNVAIQGSVARNVRMAGGQVTVAPGAELHGNVSAIGGDIRLDGRVKGYVRAAGGHVYINAPIGGDVDVASGQVELGPNANIAGKLRYASNEELQRDAKAQVHGAVERQSHTGWPKPGDVQRQLSRLAWIWTFGLMLLAAVLVATVPDFSSGLASTLQQRPGKSLLIGFGILIGVPVVALLLLVTLIGTPLALLVIALYFAVLLVGYVSTSLALGDWALRRFKPADARRKAWRTGAAVLAVLVLALLGRIPGLGPLVVFLVLLAGMGALTLLVLRGRPPSPAVTPI